MPHIIGGSAPGGLQQPRWLDPNWTPRSGHGVIERHKGKIQPQTNHERFQHFYLYQHMHIIKLVQEQNKTKHNTTQLFSLSPLYVCMYVCMHLYMYMYACMWKMMMILMMMRLALKWLNWEEGICDEEPPTFTKPVTTITLS